MPSNEWLDCFLFGPYLVVVGAELGVVGSDKSQACRQGCFEADAWYSERGRCGVQQLDLATACSFSYRSSSWWPITPSILITLAPYPSLSCNTRFTGDDRWHARQGTTGLIQAIFGLPSHRPSSRTETVALLVPGFEPMKLPAIEL